jgi:trimeric autotransporter adhesin
MPLLRLKWVSSGWQHGLRFRERIAFPMKSNPRSAFAALICVLMVTAVSTSCGDFFPSSSAIVSMTISPSSGLVAPSATTQFTVQGTLGNNQTQDVTSQVNWSSSNSSFATVNQAGLVTGVALGNVTITAKTSDLTVTAPVLVSNATSITVTPASATVTPGGTQQLVAKDNNGNVVTNYVAWSSSDTTQATVSSTGLVTVLSSSTGLGGSVTITATIGSLSSSCTINISAI